MQIPDDILLNEDLNAAVAVLPTNYNFEVGACAQHGAAFHLHASLQTSWKGIPTVLAAQAGEPMLCHINQCSTTAIIQANDYA